MKTSRFEIFSTFTVKLVKSVQMLKAQKMAEYGLKGTNAVCLCRIYESDGGLTATELSYLCETDKAQVSRCMAELIERGFVYRDKQDGRCYKQKYRLTAVGERAAADVSACMKEIDRAVNNGISTEEMEAFYATFDKLCNNLMGLVKVKF